MVVKIQKSHKSMEGTLQYNQKKANKDAARILGAFNMDPGSASFRDYANTFGRYERMNIRTGDISFQMSINPDPDKADESLTDAEALSYAYKLMEGLGYGEQPILVYEHHDIDRRHYHVVSIRTNDKGRKIKDNFEEKKLQRLMQKYAKEYHYVIGNKTAKQKRPPLNLEKMPHFNPKGGNIKEQYKDIFNEAMSYRFTTPVQFNTIMRSMGVNIDFTEGTHMEGNRMYLMFEGLDGEKTKSNSRISERELGIDAYEQLRVRMEDNSIKRPLSDEEKEQRSYARFRVDQCVAFCMEHAKTMRHFEKMLAKTGIAVTLSRTDKGQVFGATFADRASKAAYKGSELKKKFSMEKLQELANPGGTWETNEKNAFEDWKAQKRAEQAERLEAHIQHNMDLAARQAPTDYIPQERLSATRKAFYEQEDLAYLDVALTMLGTIIGTVLTGRPKISRPRPSRRKTIKRPK